MEVEMDMEEIVLRSGSGMKLFAREWRPPHTDVKAAVCLIHGMGEHSGCYRHVAKRLTDAGYAMLAYDQRGHGLSPGKRGDVPSVADLADDAAALIEFAAGRYAGLPRFLYGHSMGGNVALSCALRLQPEIGGLILTSPWLRLAFNPPPFKEWIGKGLARLWPSLTLSTGLRNADLYHGAEKNQIFDPLAHNRISARFYFALQREGEWLLASCGRLQPPLLLLHGTADNVTSFPASRELAGRLGEKCKFVPWKDGYHELHNDLEQARVMEKVIDWLDQRVRIK